MLKIVVISLYRSLLQRSWYNESEVTICEDLCVLKIQNLVLLFHLRALFAPMLKEFV